MRKNEINIKVNIPERKSKNENGKFLIDEKKSNIDVKSHIEEIMNNFSTAKPVIQKIIEDIENHKDFFKKENFILTDNSKERMALLIHFIKNGIPVLFEGNTGTSKTRTVLIACKYLKKYGKEDEKREFRRYNLSAETKIDDIMGKYVSDPKSLIGLKVQDGPYVDAYRNGKILLFDEINLASSNILQCIQQSLDNGFISIETNGHCLLRIDKDPNFSLAATQNPNKGAFSGKRQELGPEFLSRFQKIFFPDILREEMQHIAKGIAKTNN